MENSRVTFRLADRLSRKKKNHPDNQTPSKDKSLPTEEEAKMMNSYLHDTSTPEAMVTDHNLGVLSTPEHEDDIKMMGPKLDDLPTPEEEDLPNLKKHILSSTRKAAPIVPLRTTTSNK